VLKALERHQGELLSGEKDAAIERMMVSVTRMVREEVSEQRGERNPARFSRRLVVRSAQFSDASSHLGDGGTGCLGIWRRTRLGHYFHRRTLPDEIQLGSMLAHKQRTISAPVTSLHVPPTAVVEAHAFSEAKPRTDVARFFSSVDDGQTCEDAVSDVAFNPLLLHKANVQRKIDQCRVSTDTTDGGKSGQFRSGGLGRLDTTPRAERTEGQVVEQYLRRHERVAGGRRHSTVEADRLVEARAHREAAETFDRAASARRLSQLQQARCSSARSSGLSLSARWSGSMDDDRSARSSGLSLKARWSGSMDDYPDAPSSLKALNRGAAAASAQVKRSVEQVHGSQAA